jgi:type II secretory pathway pseudopilin PulG
MRLANAQERARDGFTRTEMVVIIGLLAILMAVLFVAFRIGKEQRRRAQCRVNLRQIGIALQSYAKDNQELLPDCTRRNPRFNGAVWPWDMNVDLVSDLASRGARRQFLYCPSNEMNNDRHWDFPRYSGGHTRVLGYVFLLSGVRDVPHNLARLNLKGDGARKPDEMELTVDATGSQGGDYAHVRGLVVDRSSHMSGDRPIGGNILFEDGHAAWRQYGQMKHQILAQVVWDF